MVNSLAFHKLTPDSLYWLGWLASDGSLVWDHGWTISLNLQARDKALVERFALFVGARKPREIKASNSWRCAFRSCVMGKRLCDLGITERKSHTLRVVDELVRSPQFWRGVFEGDGHFRELRGFPRVAITSSSRTFLEQFQTVFYPYCSINPNNGSWDALSCSGDARRLLTKLYLGSTDETRLERKWESLKRWVSQ